jgi:hypothetical protein
MALFFLRKNVRKRKVARQYWCKARMSHGKEEVEMEKSELELLSSDPTIIAAEINSYKQTAGRALFEIGKRLKYVRDYTLEKGKFKSWAKDNCGFDFSTATRMIKAYEQLNDVAHAQLLPTNKLFDIITLPDEIDREEFIGSRHVIPSTKESKTVEEMTIRELREIKKALKESESQRELALRDAQILRDSLESIEDKEPEIRTEYVEVTDESSEQKLRKYEELFGDVSMYEGKTTRVTNGDAITYSVFEFTEDVRKFVEKYGHLTHFAKEFNGMIGEGKAEYSNAIQSMFSLLKSIERNLSESDVVIINQ